MANKNKNGGDGTPGGFAELNKVVALSAQRFWGNEGLEPAIYGFYAADGGREVPVALISGKSARERKLMATLVSALETQRHGFMGILKVRGFCPPIPKGKRAKLLERIEISLFNKASAKDVVVLCPRYAEFYENHNRHNRVGTFRVVGSQRANLNGSWIEDGYLDLSKSVDDLMREWPGPAGVNYDVEGYPEPVVASIRWSDNRYDVAAPWLFREFGGQLYSHNCNRGTELLYLLESRHVLREDLSTGESEYRFLGRCSGCGDRVSFKSSDRSAIEMVLLPMARERLAAIKASAERREFVALASREAMDDGLALLGRRGWNVKRSANKNPLASKVGGLA